MSKTTEIICILDRSGSMFGSEEDVMGSFNSFIKEQKKLKGKAKVTLILFDNKYEVVLDRVNLSLVGKLTRDKYFTRGMTSLNDAIGKTICNVKKNKKKVIVLVQTDGEENTSIEFTSNQVKSLVKEKTAMGWEFIFAGTGLDKFAVRDMAGCLGFNLNNTIAVGKSTRDFEDMSVMYANTTTAYRVQ